MTQQVVVITGASAGVGRVALVVVVALLLAVV